MRDILKAIYFGCIELLESIISLFSAIVFSSFSCARSIGRLKQDGLSDVHILANGPSLKDIIDNHAEFLSSHDTLVVNHFANTPFFWKIRPKYYVLLDPAYFGGECPAELQDRIPILMGNLSKVDWPMTLYVPYTKAAMAHAKERLNNPNISIQFFNSTRIVGAKWFRNWAYRHNLGLPSSKNVLLPSILLMLNKGYQKLYLYGAEFSWTKTYAVNPENGKIYTDDVHFYDNTRIPLKKGGFKFDLACLVESLNATDYLQEYAQSENICIINRTVGSFIDAFQYENPNNASF